MGASFRIHRASIVPCVVLHMVVCAALGLVSGLVGFLDVWVALAVGLIGGLVHALVQWVFTSVDVVDGVISSRNFMWSKVVRINEIETVHRVRRGTWNGVSVHLSHGENVLLAAPTSSMLAPNPSFSEEIGRLCAAIALSADHSSSN